MSWLARWDSDRYLRNTFILANSYVKPDATIFLGDLFDEGLKSTNEQVRRYYNRFNSIFQCEKMYKQNGIKQIYISGDNDVGGEYSGDRNDNLASRFESYFGSMIDIIPFNSFINFIKLDLDYTVSFYNSVKRNYLLSLFNKLDKKDQSNKFNVVLNHISMLARNKHELNAVSILFYIIKSIKLLLMWFILI